MNNRFKELLYRFQNDLSTEDEVQELMQMVESGIYDDQIGDAWEDLLNTELGKRNAIGNDHLEELVDIRRRIPTDGDMNVSRSNRKARIMGWITAAAAVGIILIIAVIWKASENEYGAVSQDVSVEDLKGKTYTGKQFIQLPDGSTALLNQGSELTYPESFGKEVREVHLSGEAYFDVAHNPAVPFIVKSGSVNTRVLGTAFNVKAWPDETEIQVTVTRGKVSVGDGDKVYEELIPDEQIVVNKETNEFKKQNLDAEKSIDWKDSFFVLDKVSMEEAAKRIGSRFGISVQIENKALRNCIVNGTFLDNENVEHIISVISLAMNAEYKITDKKIIIMGGVGCK